MMADRLPQRFNLGLHRLDFVVAAFGMLRQHDVSACLREPQGNRPADALRCARYDCDFVIQSKARIVDSHLFHPRVARKIPPIMIAAPTTFVSVRG